jgi:predicted dehydrogenase
MEIYGSEGTLIASGEDAPQHTTLTLYGSRGKDPLRELEIPSRFSYVGADMPAGAPYNVGQMYSRFAHAIRTGKTDHPDFDTAVDLHHFLDDIRRASDLGQEVSVLS